MADGMKLQIVTPTERFYDGEVTMVELTTTEGDIGIYPNHIPLTAVVAPGRIEDPMRQEKLKEAACIPDLLPSCRRQ